MILEAPAPMSKEDFIRKSQNIFGDKYDYSLVNYKNEHTPVDLICKIPGHGVFEQKPRNHFRGFEGCNKCAEKKINDKIEKQKKEIFNIASKYDTLKDFREKEPYAVRVSTYYGYYDEITKNMKRPRTWTKDEVLDLAKKYTNLKDFKQNEPQAFHTMYFRGWKDDVYKNMEKLGSRYKRKVYVFEFPDNSAYVGLTFDVNGRLITHNNNVKSAVFQHVNKTGLKPEFKILTPDFLPYEQASQLEKEYIEEYKKNGWVMLNRVAGGGLGSSFKKEWTPEKIASIASQYKTRNEFQKNNSRAYAVAKILGIFDEVTKHMNKVHYWTVDEIKKRALEYKTYKDFINDTKLYWAAQSRGLLDDISKHMENKKYFWTVDEIKKRASEYKTYKDFFNDKKLYIAAQRKGLLDDIKAMFNHQRFQTIDEIKKKALEYKTYKDFINDRKLYTAAQFRGILPDIRAMFNQQSF